MDSFSEQASTLTSPARNAGAVVPSDTLDLVQVARAIYVGQTGAVSVEMVDGGVAIFANVQAGSLIPLRARKVRSTGTTATSIVALW